MNQAINMIRAFGIQAKSYGFLRQASRAGSRMMYSPTNPLFLRRAMIGAGLGSAYNVGSDMTSGYGFSLSRAMSGAISGAMYGAGYNAIRSIGMAPLRGMRNTMRWAARDVGRLGRRGMLGSVGGPFRPRR